MGAAWQQARDTGTTSLTGTGTSSESGTLFIDNALFDA